MTIVNSFVIRIIHGLIQALQHSGEKRARAYLLSLSDEQLRDYGITRKEVEMGRAARAWDSSVKPKVIAVDVALQDSVPAGKPSVATISKDGETKLAA